MKPYFGLLFRDNGDKTIQIIWRGDPVERKALQTSSKSLMNELGFAELTP